MSNSKPNLHEHERRETVVTITAVGISILSAATPEGGLRSEQSPAAPQQSNSIYFDSRGTGGSGSYAFYYERRVTPRVSVRGGLAHYANLDEAIFLTALFGEDALIRAWAPSVGASYLTHPLRSHHFELGATFSQLFFQCGEDDCTETTITEFAANAGYRYQPASGHIFIRAGLAAELNSFHNRRHTIDDERPIWPSFYSSLGFSF